MYFSPVAFEGQKGLLVRRRRVQPADSQKAKKQQKAKQNKQTGDKQLAKRNPTGREAVLSDDIADRYCKRMI